MQKYIISIVFAAMLVQVGSLFIKPTFSINAGEPNTSEKLAKTLAYIDMLTTFKSANSKAEAKVDHYLHIQLDAMSQSTCKTCFLKSVSCSFVLNSFHLIIYFLLPRITSRSIYNVCHSTKSNSVSITL